MVDRYVDLSVETRPDVLQGRVLDDLMSDFPGWVPSDAHLEVRLAASIMRREAETRMALRHVGDGVFDMYGAEIMQVLRVLSNPATGTVRFATVDASGWNIERGTQVEARITGDETVRFATVETITIQPGQMLGDVLVEAVVEGTGGNGVEPQELELVDSHAAVDSVELLDTTGGGVDRETEAAYRDRLAARNRIAAPRPILSDDAAVIVAEVPGVHRALAVDNYDPDTGDTEAERTVTVAAVDSDGLPVVETVEAEIVAALEELREINFRFPVIQPEYVSVDVEMVIRPAGGWEADTAVDNAVQAVRRWLSPARFAGGAAQPPRWDGRDYVRYLEVATVAGAAQGVDFVETLSVNGGTNDVALDGVAVLPAPLEDEAPGDWDGPVSTVEGEPE